MHSTKFDEKQTAFEPRGEACLGPHRHSVLLPERWRLELSPSLLLQTSTERERSRCMWKVDTALDNPVAATCRRRLPRRDRVCAACCRDGDSIRPRPHHQLQPAGASSQHGDRRSSTDQSLCRRPLLGDHPRGRPIVRIDRNKHPPVTGVTGGSMGPPCGCERGISMIRSEPRKKVRMLP